MSIYLYGFGKSRQPEQLRKGDTRWPPNSDFEVEAPVEFGNVSPMHSWNIMTKPRFKETSAPGRTRSSALCLGWTRKYILVPKAPQLKAHE